MADCYSSASVTSHLDGDENRGENETVNTNYAEIIVIRHGETEWNSSRRIQGQLDVDLNDVGRKQAYAVADRMSREPKISAVYSSDSRRAFDTAEIIAKGCGGLEVIKDPGLRERHLGDLQGLVFQEIAKINPVAYKAFLSNDQEIPGGGESFNQAYERCTSALERVAKNHIGERVIVVSHGGSIESLLVRASLHLRELIKGKIHNTSVNVLHISEKGEWSIKSWGDASHLNETGFLQTAFGGDRNSVNKSMVSKSNYWTRINNRLHLKDVRMEWMQFPSGCEWDVYSPEAWSLIEKINSGFWYTPYDDLEKEPLSFSTSRRETEWLEGIAVYKKQATELLREFDASYKDFVEAKILLGSFLEYVSARERYSSDLRMSYMAIDWSFLLPELLEQEREKLALFERKMDRLLARVQKISKEQVKHDESGMGTDDERKESNNIVSSQIIKEADQDDEWEELEAATAKHKEEWELLAKQIEEREILEASVAKERCQEDDEEAWDEIYYVMKQKRLNRVGANRRYNVRGR